MNNTRIEITNPFRAKDFSEGTEYPTSTDQKTLKDFFEKTGIVLAHRIKGNDGQIYHFTMHGYRTENSGKWYNEVQDEHVVIHHEEPQNPNFKGSTPIEFPDALFKLNYALSSVELTLPKNEYLARQKEILTKYHPGFETKGLQQIMPDTFGEIFLLYEDGTLLRGNKEYAKNVSKLVRLGVGTKYIIYNDNSLEPVESFHYPGCCQRGLTKIIARNQMIALLEKDHLILLTSSDDSRGYAEHHFTGIGDIDFKTIEDGSDGELLIKSGAATIKLQINEYEPHFVGI